jgi:UDP-perosamine 4-acetyltransferase
MPEPRATHWPAVGSRKIWIIGAGGHALVLSETLRDLGVVPDGSFVASLDDPSSPHLRHPILGTQSDLLQKKPGEAVVVNGVGGVRANPVRKNVYDEVTAHGFPVLGFIHPSATLVGEIELGDGAQILAGAVIQPGARIGKNAIINTRASIDHECSIGDHCHIAPGVVLSGEVTVGAGTHIGTGATVMQGAKIGAGVTVGAGAVVIGPVPDGKTVVGVPAR